MKPFFLILGAILFFSKAYSYPTLSQNNIYRVVQAMSLEEKARLVTGIGTFWAGNSSLRNWRDIPGIPGGTYAVPRLGIPCIYFGDGPLGIKMNESRMLDHRRFSTTAEPVPLLLASSWNPQIVYDVAQDIGEECRDYGVDILLGPSINIIRHPLCGRNHEYYSEDPYLAGIMAEAFIRGVQSVGIGATVKHFAANNQETNKTENNVIVSQRALREIYLKPFEMSTHASPWAFMTSYNGINGISCSANQDLLIKILRKDWNFAGVVMTDWGGGYNPVSQLKAGNDLSEPGSEEDIHRIIEAVNKGELDIRILNRSVARILLMLTKSHTYHRDSIPNQTDLPSHQLLARAAGAESAVLLKNSNHALPLKNVKSVAIYGRTGYYMLTGGIGAFEYNAANYDISLAEAFRNTGYTVDFDLAKKYFLMGPNQLKATWLLHNDEEINTDEAVLEPSELKKESRQNDVAVIVLGHVSSEGTDRPRNEYYFSEKEIKLIQDVCQTYHHLGKKVILILNIPGPMELETIKYMPDAILLAYQGGEQIGNWLVDLLVGKISPSGKLTVTFAKKLKDYPSTKNFPVLDKRYEISGMMKEMPEMKNEQESGARPNLDFTSYKEGIYVGYRYFDTFKKEVSYPFGYGLSY